MWTADQLHEKMWTVGKGVVGAAIAYALIWSLTLALWAMSPQPEDIRIPLADQPDSPHSVRMAILTKVGE